MGSVGLVGAEGARSYCRANKEFPKGQGRIREHVTIHDTRRTFASRAAEAGMPIKRLAAILGHASVAVTEKYYAHVNDDDSAYAMKKIASGLGLPSVLDTKYPAAK